MTGLEGEQDGAVEIYFAEVDLELVRAGYTRAVELLAAEDRDVANLLEKAAPLRAHVPGLPPRAPQMDAHRRRPGARQRRGRAAHQGGVGLPVRRVTGRARRGRLPRPERRVAVRAEPYGRPQSAEGLRVARAAGGGGRGRRTCPDARGGCLHGQAW